MKACEFVIIHLQPLACYVGFEITLAIPSYTYPSWRSAAKVAALSKVAVSSGYISELLEYEKSAETLDPGDGAFENLNSGK